jgi:hypothetical protein
LGFLFLLCWRRNARDADIAARANSCDMTARNDSRQVCYVWTLCIVSGQCPGCRATWIGAAEIQPRNNESQHWVWVYTRHKRPPQNFRVKNSTRLWNRTDSLIMPSGGAWWRRFALVLFQP